MPVLGGKGTIEHAISDRTMELVEESERGSYALEPEF
jgi:hypothetical protein